MAVTTNNSDNSFDILDDFFGEDISIEQIEAINSDQLSAALWDEIYKQAAIDAGFTPMETAADGEMF